MIYFLPQFTRSGIFRYSLILISAVLLVNCAKDRTLDQWRRDQVSGEVAKIKAVSGTYSGDLINDSGTVIGQAQMVLEADTRVADTKDRPGAEQQAVIRGQFGFQDGKVHRISFQDGAYDSASGSFSTSIPIPDSAGVPVIVQITGTITDSGMNGRIQADKYSERARTFNLSRATAAASDLLTGDSFANSASGNVSSGSTRTYSGTSIWKTTNETHPVSLVITDRSETVERDFLQVFTSTRIVDATLTVQLPGRDGSDSAPLSHPIYFQGATWDQRLGTLSGTWISVNQSSGLRSNGVLNCQSSQGSSPTRAGSCRPGGWSCTYQSSTDAQLFQACLNPEGA